MSNKTIDNEPVSVCVLRIIITKDKILPFFCANIQFLIKIHDTPETLWRHTGCGTLGWSMDNENIHFSYKSYSTSFAYVARN
jgi:hypothetical protein